MRILLYFVLQNQQILKLKKKETKINKRNMTRIDAVILGKSGVITTEFRVYL